MTTAFGIVIGIVILVIIIVCSDYSHFGNNRYDKDGYDRYGFDKDGSRGPGDNRF